MILSPLLGLQVRPNLSCWIKQTRTIRPSIKVARDKFQLELDVRNFSKDEIRVKARPEYVIIEGKKEVKTKKGFIMRQFIRKFKLPHGCVPECMESKLSSDGKLTIIAPRNVCDRSLPCETLIPIKTCVPENNDNNESILPLQQSKSPPDKKP